MERRDFVRSLPVVATGVVVAGAGLSLTGCAGVPYVVPRSGPRGLTIPASSLSAPGVFVQAAGMDRPLFLSRAESGEPVAVLASCTHQGCQPEPLGGRLVCPCHGSEFEFSGTVLAGPAQRPLTRFEVVVEGDSFIVLTDGREPR